MDNLELLLNTYGLAAIFAVMLVKGIGVPIPIPSDAIMLATAARVASGRMALSAAFIVILIALVVGGCVQFLLVRGPARQLIYRYGRYLGLTEARLDAMAERLRKAGVIGIAVAIFTPGARSVAIPASGIAAHPLRTFSLGLALGSAAFLVLHFALGYAGGALLTTLGERVSLPLVFGSLVVIFGAALAVWFVLRKRRQPDAPASEVLAQAYHAWHEAACPACLALGALGQPHTPMTRPRLSTPAADARRG
jgi:membrane protein DedA with SNARE-associated domain